MDIMGRTTVTVFCTVLPTCSSSIMARTVRTVVPVLFAFIDAVPSLLFVTVTLSLLVVQL